MFPNLERAVNYYLEQIDESYLADHHPVTTN
jgi:hypothetical protein